MSATAREMEFVPFVGGNDDALTGVDFVVVYQICDAEQYFLSNGTIWLDIDTTFQQYFDSLNFRNHGHDGETSISSVASITRQLV